MNVIMPGRWPYILFATLLSGLLQAQTGTAVVRRAPTLNGTIEGSIHQLTAENTTLNSNAAITGDLLVPGTPTVRLNGRPSYGGTIDGTGASTPSNRRITLNGNASLRHVVRRTDPIALPVVDDPPQPAGTRSISINNASEGPGDFATLRHLTLNGNVGQIAVPPGTYGNLIANGNSGFILGIAGAAQPALYNFQNLTLNGNSPFAVVGPVVVTIEGGFSTNGNMGHVNHPEWLKLRIAGGGLSLNGNVTIHAYVEAPDGTITLNGNTRLIGGAASDRLIVNGNSLLRLIAANQPPTVVLTSPANGSSYFAPASLSLAANAADIDGSITKVEFYSGELRLGQATTAPYQFTVSPLPAGSYTFSAKATDNLGALASSGSVGVTVVGNLPPSISIATPRQGATVTAPGAFVFAVAAADPDGTVAKVEFYMNGVLIGDDTVAPFEMLVQEVGVGSHLLVARAFDALGLSVESSPVNISVRTPNQPPTVALVAPTAGTVYTAPAAFFLAATAVDLDGTVAKIEFYVGATKLGETTAPPYQLALFEIPPGAYSYSVRAYDNHGDMSESAAVTVSVNQSPIVTLITPDHGSTYTSQQTVPLTATAGDSDGTISRVEFYADDALLGIDNAAPFEFAWTGGPAGLHQLRAIAYDNHGAVATSARRAITILAPGVLFGTGFEPTEGYSLGALAGQKGWGMQGQVSIVATPVFSGQHAIAIEPGQPAGLALRAFNDSEPGRITFLDFYVRPAAQSSPQAGALLDSTAAAVALARNGATGALHLYGVDGAGSGRWSSPVASIALDSEGRAMRWLRLTVREDFASKRWDLYLDGKIVAADAGFIDASATTPTGFALSGHSTFPTGLDALVLTTSNPLFLDADHDGIDDAWESAHGIAAIVNDRNADPDFDGLTNLEEFMLGTHPTNSDTDGDALPDAWEVRTGHSPLQAEPNTTLTSDTDGDGLTLAQELRLGTDPAQPDHPGLSDSDGDRLPDVWEAIHGTNARQREDLATLNDDGDADGLSLFREFEVGTHPSKADSDGDGIPDGTELHLSLNPLLADGALDPDGDGVHNLDEYRRGTDPHDYYNGIEHEILPFIGGEFDLGANGLLAVRVVDRHGVALINAPVVLELQDGTSQIALTPDGAPIGRSAEVRTDSSGVARAYIKSP